jgi:platelet-activating factor acetylhydrolase isoform II
MTGAEGPVVPSPRIAGSAGERDDGPLPRRHFLGAGAAALGLATAGCAAPPHRAGPRLRLTLPPTTGPHPIGTVSLHLVDRSRRDPWLSASRPRELMVSIWYPALDDSRYQRAPWMPPAAGRLFLTQLIPSPVTGPASVAATQRVSLTDVRLPVTTARYGAPADLAAGRCPVLLYSPGYGDDRELGTGLVSDLASRGYIVVTTDYTYEAAEVEFPGCRVETGRQPPIPQAVQARLADTRFVLGQLAAMNSGAHPDAVQRPLPAGLAAALDLTKVGIFGHSLGGATAAGAMAADRRIQAGLNLDGSIIVKNLPIPGDPAALLQVKRLARAVATRIGSRPFMIMTHDGHGPQDDPTLQEFLAGLTGWRRCLTMTGSGHYSYTDDEEFLSQLTDARIIPLHLVSQVVIPAIGTINPARAISTERAYIGAFFDQHLRNRPSSLLNRPSPHYPAIQFISGGDEADL